MSRHVTGRCQKNIADGKVVRLCKHPTIVSETYCARHGGKRLTRLPVVPKPSLWAMFVRERFANWFKMGISS